MADNVVVGVEVKKSDAEQGILQLRASFRVLEESIANFHQTLTNAEKETIKFVSTGVTPLEAGVAGLTSTFKGPAAEIERFVEKLRGFQAVQAEINKGVAGTVEANKAAADAERNRARVFAEANQAEKANLAARVSFAKNVLAQINTEEEANLQRVIARGKIALADYQATERQKTVITKAELQARQQDTRLGQPINQFLEVTHGGASGLAQFQAQQQSVQASLGLFASTILSKPVESLRILATDSRAAGAAMQFLKGELDFVIGSRFGAIAIGFAIFGTIEEVIRRSVSSLIDFEEKFARVQALSVGDANAAAVNARAQAFIQEAALKTGVALGELADKYLIAASATNNQTTAQGLFTNALRFSVATGADFKDSLLLLSGVLNTYGHTLGTSLTDTEKLEVLTSKLFTTFKISRGEANDFVQALKFVTASANASHISFDSLLGVLGGLADKMQEGSRGGRGLGQVLSTIIRDADRFNEAFNLGLTKREIVEAPLAALEAIRTQIQAGTLDATRFAAETADLFPQNAARVFLSLQQLTTAEVQRYTNEIKSAVSIQDVANKALDVTTVQWGILKRISEITLSGMIGGAGIFGEILKAINVDLALVGKGLVLTATGIQLSAVAAGGLSVVLSTLAEKGPKAAAEVFVALKDTLVEIATNGAKSIETLDNLGRGFDEQGKKAKGFTDILSEANKAQEEAAKARVARGEVGVPTTGLQQLEIDLARGLTVELEKQVRIREEIVSSAERALKNAVTSKDQEQAASQLTAALNALNQTRLKGIQEANEAILLQSEKLTEKQRSQATISQAFAADEIRARRGIIAALQGQQAIVEDLIAAQKIGASDGEKRLVQLQREQNAQLEGIKKVQHAADQADKQRLEALEKVLDAQKRIREAEDKVADTQQRVIVAQREQERQRRTTLETEATGTARILLATQLEATAPLLAQLDLLRKVQEDANLPLKERIRLLNQELGIIEKIQGKEKSRLELEIEFGKNLPALLAAQRKFVEAQLRADPVKFAAAQQLAAQEGRPGEEGTILAGARVLQQRELAITLEGDRKKELDALKSFRDRKAELQGLMFEDLQRDVQESIEKEKERAAATQRAIRESEQAAQDLARAQSKGLAKEPPPPLPDLFHRDVQIFILPDGTFTNLPPITSEPKRAFPSIQPQSLLDQDRLLQEFKTGVQEISFGLTDEFSSPIAKGRDELRLFKAELQAVALDIPVTAQRVTASLTDQVEQKLIDRLSRELSFPTGSA